MPGIPHSGPQLAVSAGIFREGKILLVRRAREPAKGVYTFPGGRVEFGESLTEALAREIREGNRAGDQYRWPDRLPRGAAGTNRRPRPLCRAAIRLPLGGNEIALNDELDDAKWLTPGALGGLPITHGLEDTIRSACAMLGI